MSVVSRDPDGHTRWRRLWPRDAADLFSIALGFVGLVLSGLSVLGVDGAEFGSPGVVLGPLLALHGSSSPFFFLGLALYLMRWGRTIGTQRRWVWGGFLFTVPLWFLSGQAIAVRGAGDVTLLVVPWNLAALGIMWVGAWRTLRDRPAQA